MTRITFESRPALQRYVAVGTAAAGTVLMIAARNHDGLASGNAQAGFLLGGLLLVIGIAAVFTVARQVIVIDPELRRIVVSDTRPLGTTTRTITFGDIERTGIGYLGKRSNYVHFYYITLHLRNGDTYPLFAPGRFFEGSSDRTVIEDRRQKLEQLLGQSS